MTSCVSCKRANQLRQSPGGRLTLAPCLYGSADAFSLVGVRPAGEAETGFEPAYTALQAAA